MTNDSKQATVTIAEFLTARLDEDACRLDLAAEAEAEALRHDGMPDTTAQEIMAFWLDPETGTEWPRVLADIAAKRRMTERAWLSVQYLPPEMRTPSKDAAAYDAFWVLAELASVYSEHPDYQQEWKS